MLAFLCTVIVKYLYIAIVRPLQRLSLDENEYEPCSMKKGAYASARSFDSCQAAQSMQTDTFENLLLFVNFLHVRGPFYVQIQSIVRLNVKQEILDSSELKESADRQQFQICCKWQKALQTGYEQFLLFPQCFLKTSTADT